MIDLVENQLKSNRFVILYFSTISCNVCKILYPKIEELKSNYDNLIITKILIDENPEFSSIYNVFTVPTILFFIDGKEYIRESRHISVPEFENKINRLIDMVR